MTIQGIKQLEDGSYAVQYSARHPITRVPKTLRRRRNEKGLPIKTMAEAQRIYRTLVIEVTKAIEGSVHPSWPVLVSQFLTSAQERGNTVKTVDNYRLGLEAHTFPLWRNRQVNEITTEEIRKLVKDGLGDRSDGQKKNILKFIRAVFRFGVEAGVINRDPTPQVKFQTGDKIKGVLTEPQIEILLNRAKIIEMAWYPHWAMALYTGMRNGELYALTWDKVDLDRRLIKVDCSWNNVDQFKSTKSGDDRMVEIAPNLIPLLAALKLKQTDSVYVLPRLDKWDKGEQARELRMFLMSLGLPQVRFHDLRASWATVMLGRGVEPAKVMIMGGWKDMKTMMIYMRKAGISIQGITDNLVLHNSSSEHAQVVKLGSHRTS